MTDLDLARLIAAKFHAQQMYGIYPYTHHLNCVEKSVTEAYPADDRLPVIAQLHDIIEDTRMTEDMLRLLFEKDVVDAVVALSHQGGPREVYLEQVKANPLALKVKMHDTLCNLNESMLRNDMKRVKKYGFQLAVLAG